jgi:hypothetical protein
VRRRRSTFTESSVSPQGIDDWSGFKVDLEKLDKEWTGLRTTRPDPRNPQDYVRGLPDKMALPFARPETPDRFVSVAIQYDNGLPIILEDGSILMTDGEPVVTV